MPNRIIKESICVSGSIDMLTWFEEAFFYRLIVNCDDFGRFDARPAVLRARLFPLKDITTKQIEAALSKLATAGMVRVYEYDRQPFLQLENWSKHQSVRNKRSKYPDPNALESTCKQLHANVPVIQSESESLSESVSESNSGGGGNARDPEPENPFGFGSPPEPAVEAYIAKELPPLTPGNIGQLDALQEAGMQDDAIKLAVDIAAANNRRTWAYVHAILRRWLENGITTAGAAKAAEDKYQAGKEQNRASDKRQGAAGNAGRSEGAAGSAGDRYKPDPAEIERIARARGVL